MNDSLDDRLNALRAEAPAAGYALIDARVWRRIDELRDTSTFAPALYAVRAAGVATALLLGVAGGGATAVAVAGEVQEVSAFSVDARLAPSTLLDDHG